MSEATTNAWQSPPNIGLENSQSPVVQQPEPPKQSDGRLWATITGNPYFSAGFGLIGVGAGLTVLRQGLNLGTSLLRRRLLVTLEIPSKDKSYLWFLQWMSQQSARRTQHLAVETTYKQHDNGSVSTTFGLVPGPGNHFFKWRGVWLQASTEYWSGQ
jgi:chaperone BCS1